MERQVYRLKVILRGSEPAIWRRLEVHGDTTLCELHRILQVAMGWMDEHLHEFERAGTRYGDPSPELEMDEDERRVLLGEVLRRAKARMVYEYDFGDGWRHDVVLEHIGPGEADVSYPRVVAGERACPPEDVGGIGGYYGFLEALADTADPRHEDMLEWCGEAFDPGAFDIDEVNRRLLKTVQRRGRMPNRRLQPTAPANRKRRG